MRRLRAMLFDLDGTLLDTAPDLVAALNALRLEHGLAPLPFEEVRPAVSHGSAQVVKAGFPTAGAAESAALQRRFLDLYRAALSAGTRLFPGMDEVLDALAVRGLCSGVVTNKPAWLTEPLIDELKLRDRLAVIVSGDTVAQPKPSPLPLLHAAKLAGVAPAECIFVGDAERDIQAAHAAGMPALIARYGYLHDADRPDAWGADGDVERPLDLLAWIARDGA
jgi:phosphoglycolate phosphatase